MTELRKDYFLDRYTVIASARSARPKEFKKENSPVGTCAFCPGNEETTPKETGRLGNPWKMRWFPNKYPVFEPKGNLLLKNKSVYSNSSAYGLHEVLVETPSNNKQVWDFSASELAVLLSIYNNRISQLEKKKKIQYVTLVKNQGRMGGASIMHSHTQIAALSFIPPLLKQEIAAYSGRNCNHCKIIKIERKTSRKCYENDTMIAIAPYASRFDYELWIFPKRHLTKLSQFTKKEIDDFASILGKALKKLKKLNADFNYYLHYSPAKANLHFHLELTPRFENWAGIELSTSLTVTTISPEQAAKFYRG